MTRVWLVLAALLVSSLVYAVPAYAKGPVDKITLAGQGLAEPVEITDSRSLESFDPWMRGFIDWNRGQIAEPPLVGKTYEVSFHLGDRGTIYVMQYSTDPSGGPGYIYIPGPADAWYSLNIRTIMGGSSDAWDPNGRWHHATLGWGMLMRQALGSVGHAPTSEEAAGGRKVTMVWGLSLGVLALLGVAAFSIRLRQRRTWLAHRAD
jgi:hypothetical protein